MHEAFCMPNSSAERREDCVEDLDGRRVVSKMGAAVFVTEVFLFFVSGRCSLYHLHCRVTVPVMKHSRADRTIKGFASVLSKTSLASSLRGASSRRAAWAPPEMHRARSIPRVSRACAHDLHKRFGQAAIIFTEVLHRNRT